MTIQGARQIIMNSIQKIYCENEADNISILLLEYISGFDKVNQILKKDYSLSEEHIAKVKDAIPRLENHEPIQYVINEAWFYELKFYVNKNVLIPRPETEELIEWIISELQCSIATLKILDIGTGSGCIPILLKRKLKKAEVWSCDISAKALQIAKQNASSLSAEINFIELDFLNELTRNQLPIFDIIVSNPPYIPNNDKKQMNKNVLDYEPHVALFVPNNDFLVFYKTIAHFSKTHLKKNGSIFLELHESHGKEVQNIFTSKDFSSVILKKDMQGKDRMMLAKKNGPRY